jgi:hypothetical protein
MANINFKVVKSTTPQLPVDFALAYAALGWAVLPVWSVDAEGRCRCGRPNSEHGHNPGKHPHTRLAPRGHHDASTAERVIRDWFAEDPDAGIGLALAESGLLALDIDPRNGGVESLEALEAEHGILHSAVVAATQGGGEHRLFLADSGVTYPSTLGAGLDLKHHGYICVEPTLGPMGAYTWRAGANPLSRSSPARPSALPRLISEKGRGGSTDYSLTERGGVPVATAQTFDDLRSALAHVDADDYTTWVNVGMALRPYGEAGYRVWAEWSARSEKFNANQSRQKWERDLHGAHSITYRSIFRMALDAGWVAPSAAAPVAEKQAEDNPKMHPLALGRAVPAGAEEVTLFEYVFDDFMSCGVNVIAGAPGVGKTTLIVPLALAAAHLCPADYQLRPAVRRNVIIVTESPTQVQRVVYSVANWGYTGLEAQEFESCVRVIPAVRLDPVVVATVAREYAGWTYSNSRRDGTVHEALPLVVFDTANAVFDLESENDNAEVGRAMSAIKESFVGFPVMIVAHTAKAQGTEEVEHFTPRGAGAWSGDAQGVYTVFKDGEGHDSPRVLKAAKVRFPVAHPELTFDLVSNHERHPDVLGFEREVWFNHSVARVLKAGERAQLKEDKKAAVELDSWNTLCDEIIDLVRTHPEHSRTYYERLPSAKGGPRGSQERKERAINSLLADGCLERIELENPMGRATHFLRVNESVVEEINSQQAKGRLQV